MDLETVALMATLSQVAHQLQHFSDNAKNQKAKDAVAPLVNALKGAIAGLVA